MSERQHATNLSEVRADHLLRYEFALKILEQCQRLDHVIDAGAGVGYGSNLLSSKVGQIDAIEISNDAEEIYRQHWHRDNISFHRQDLLEFQPKKRVDAVVSFEFIEHVSFYREAIARFATWSDLIIISTPNELVRPHKQHPVNPFHFRHFTPDEMAGELAQQDFEVCSWHCQQSGSSPEIREGTEGKFMIAIAQRRGSNALQVGDHRSVA